MTVLKTPLSVRMSTRPRIGYLIDAAYEDGTPVRFGDLASGIDYITSERVQGVVCMVSLYESGKVAVTLEGEDGMSGILLPDGKLRKEGSEM